MRDTTRNLIRRLELRPSQAVPVDAWPGTIVRCLEGTIWLTQEGLFSDCILIAGTRFVSASNGKIVLSSVDGASAARIYTQGCSGRHEYVGSGLQLDSGVVARIERKARRARNEEILRLLRKLGAFIASAWQDLKAEVGRRKSEGSTPVDKRNHAAGVH